MAKTARAIGQLIALARAPRRNSGHKFPEVAFCLITGLLLAKTARAKSAKIARALAGNPGHKFPEVAFCTGLLLAKTARAIDQLIALARAPRGNSGHKFPEVAFCLITGLLLAKTAARYRPINSASARARLAEIRGINSRK